MGADGLMGENIRFRPVNWLGFAKRMVYVAKRVPTASEPMAGFSDD